VSKVRTFANGHSKGGGPYSVGALAHFLKNRFYIGEMIYGGKPGETHTREHASIIDRPTKKLIVEAIRAKEWPGTEPKGGLSDRAVIDRYIARMIVRPNSIDVEVEEPTPAPPRSPAPEATVIAGAAAAAACTPVISLPWSASAFASVKGVVHQPEAKPG
jgi:hypothetical protein